MSRVEPLLPGATLGVMGGGQLGRMFVHAAQALGLGGHLLAQALERRGVLLEGRAVRGQFPLGGGRPHRCQIRTSLRRRNSAFLHQRSQPTLRQLAH